MARIKRRAVKKPESKQVAKRPTRQEAELVAQQRVSNKLIELPEFRETLILNCLYQGKKVIVDLNYHEHVSQFPNLQNLIHQFQVAIETWARETKSSKTAEASFYAQQLFLEFLCSSDNAKPINNISELTPSVLRRFIKTLQKRTSSEASVRKHFTGITSILRSIYKSSYSELPEIGTLVGKFPVPPREKTGQNAIPPLDQRSFNELVLVLQDHFDAIKSLPGKVQALLNDGQPTLDEMQNYNPWLKLPNALWHYHHKCLNARTSQIKNNNFRLLKKNGWCVDTLETLYQQEWEKVKDTASDPKSDSVVFKVKDRKEDQERNLSLVLKEYYQKYSDYPLQWDVEDSYNFLRSTGHIGEDARYKTHSAHELYQYSQFLEHPLFKRKFKGVGALFFHIYPTVTSVSVCLYLLKVQTGWNLTVLLGLEFESDFESMFKPCPISQDYVLLVGEKARGVLAEKYHRTKKNNKYGTYRVLKFLWEFGKELREHTGSKSPWAYLKVVFDKKEPITNDLQQFTHHSYSNDLCKEKLIHNSKGEPLKGFAFESIRKNLADIEDEISEHDIQKLASMLQNSPAVAEAHYRNKNITQKRLRNVQESWAHNFTYFQGSFNQNSMLENPSDVQLGARGQEEGVKVQIITTDGITPVSICKNPHLPDWHGHRTSVGENERCSYFQGCSNCSQCVVFSETLPFIHRRLQILDQLRSKMNVGDWETSYHIEWYAWKEVLELWPNQDEVAKADTLSRAVKLPIRPQLYGA